ncbi:hypothetical protein JYT96_00550 [Gammaproteobacteria bacterium AH-315-C21]|nr:hypothetical protein [Gammaproteobacteria bacterium AH-315-C21]
MLCLFLTAYSEPTQPNTLDTNNTVLAFGDSLTFGSGTHPEKSYPAKLVQRINRKVINAGAPGEISADGLTRLPPLLNEHKPALLIVAMISYAKNRLHKPE